MPRPSTAQLQIDATVQCTMQRGSARNSAQPEILESGHAAAVRARCSIRGSARCKGVSLPALVCCAGRGIAEAVLPLPGSDAGVRAPWRALAAGSCCGILLRALAAGSCCGLLLRALAAGTCCSLHCCTCWTSGRPLADPLASPSQSTCCTHADLCTPGHPQSTVPSKWGERVSRLYSRATWASILDLGAAAGFEFNYDSALVFNTPCHTKPQHTTTQHNTPHHNVYHARLPSAVSALCGMLSCELEC